MNDLPTCCNGDENGTCCPGPVADSVITYPPMRPATPEQEWPFGEDDGYAIALCVCPEGAYLGARMSGTPCVCERCRRITLDQWEFIVARIATPTTRRETEPETDQPEEGERDD